jgi:hypothetical protein
MKYYYHEELDEPQWMKDDLDACATMTMKIWPPHEHDDQKMM